MSDMRRSIINNILENIVSSSQSLRKRLGQSYFHFQTGRRSQIHVRDAVENKSDVMRRFVEGRQTGRVKRGEKVEGPLLTRPPSANGQHRVR